jgi:hypothetical protein
MASVLPDVNQTIKDGGLGILPVSGNNILALVGVSSAGTVNVVQSFSDITTLKSTLGTGPLVEAAAHVLAVSGQQVVCVKVTPTAPTTPLGTVTNAGTGASVLALTGTPADSYALQVKIVTGATGPTTGLATFQYSLDGGITWSAVISLPTGGAYAIPNTGITATFGTGTLVAGDIYSAAATGPGFITSDLGTALDVLLADTSTYFAVYVVGVPANSTPGPAAGASFSAYLEAKLINAETSLYRYTRGIIAADDDTDANLKTEYTAQSYTRTVVAAGYAKLVSQLSGAQMKKPAATSIAARAAAVAPSQDLGAVADGALKGVTALYRDEQKTPALDAARFATLRTIVGLPGYYVTNPRIMAAPTSDFQYLQLGRVMDIASTLNRFALLYYLNSSVRVNKTTGLILEADAQAIEQRVLSIVRSGTTQPGYASDVTVVLDRTVNVLSTGRISTKLRVTPLGYLKGIDTEVSLYNPALTPV